MKTLLVYNDEGVSVGGKEILPVEIQNLLDNKKVKVINIAATDILSTSWENECIALIMPGGADLPYLKKLSGLGNQKIKNYVESGGAYLGFCAGAYYASSYIEFEKGNELEVVGERELCFYPGKAIGPAYGKGKFSYNSENGAKLAKIKTPLFDESIDIYYNGGCSFESERQDDKISVLAYYEDLPNRPVAALKVNVEKGIVVLTGVHPEYPISSGINESSVNSKREDFLKFLMINAGLESYLKVSL